MFDNLYGVETLLTLYRRDLNYVQMFVAGCSQGHTEVQQQASWGNRKSHQRNINVIEV